MKTRERILATSLNLFNRHGAPNISTVEIANEMNISPGNLYYHFRNKEEIIKSIFDRFEQELNLILEIREDTFTNMVEIWLYLKLMYEKLWQYRFLFRDLNNLISKTPFMGKHIKRILGKQHQTCLYLCQCLTNADRLSIRAQHLPNLADNMTFKMMFWINQSYLFHGSENQDSEKLITHAVYDLLTLLETHLDTESLDLMRELSLGGLEQS